MLDMLSISSRCSIIATAFSALFSRHCPGEIDVLYHLTFERFKPCAELLANSSLSIAIIGQILLFGRGPPSPLFPLPSLCLSSTRSFLYPGPFPACGRCAPHPCLKGRCSLSTHLFHHMSSVDHYAVFADSVNP